MRLLLALALVASVILPLASAGGEPTIVLTYEAAGVEWRSAGAWSRTPAASAAEPGGSAWTTDGRVDAGRLLVAVPASAKALNLTVADDVYPRTPVRLEWFAKDGGSMGTTLVCASRHVLATHGVPAGARTLALWPHAVDLVDLAPPSTGSCPLDSPSGAAKGAAFLAFE